MLYEIIVDPQVWDYFLAYEYACDRTNTVQIMAAKAFQSIQKQDLSLLSEKDLLLHSDSRHIKVMVVVVFDVYESTGSSSFKPVVICC